MLRKRREYGSALKGKVALEALKEGESISALASRFDVHPTLIGQWKKRVIEGVETLFTSEGAARRKKESEPDQAELYEQIGRLKMQLEWLKKKVAQVE
jgi:transposase